MLMVSESHDVYENLALEEHLLATWQGPGPLVLLYRNAPAVVVGAHQNTHREADEAAMERRGICLARRVSGGGAVYHDKGNICFSFVLPGQTPSRLDMSRHLQPVLRALQSLGLPAKASDRNDILLEGKKISGTAARLKSECLLFHGTLLYDANLANLQEVLRPRRGLVWARGAASVKSPVANIRAAWNLGSADAFMAKLAAALCPNDAARVLPAGELRAVRKLAVEKYAAWEWIYGHNPPCAFAAFLVSAGGVRQPVTLCLKHNIIGEVERANLQFLAGTPFEKRGLEKRLAARGFALLLDEGAPFNTGPCL